MISKNDWNQFFWSVLIIVFASLMASCGGGSGSDSATGSLPTTNSTASLELIVPEDDPSRSDDQASTENYSALKVSYMKGSNTWPAGYAGSDSKGFNYVSTTDDPLGPWYAESVHFKGNNAGGKDLIYRYRLKFEKNVEISSIGISGVAWGTFRLLNNRQYELKRIALPGGNDHRNFTIHTYGSSGKIYHIEEIENENPNSRYRSKIEVNFSQGCASQADIILSGNRFSDISGIYPDSTFGWVVDGDSIYNWYSSNQSGGNDIWVEYEVDLTEGRWNIGLCAINHFGLGREGLGPAPEWYPYFELSSNLTDEIILIPASDTNLKSGYFSFEVPADGQYTVRFRWLNNEGNGTNPDGSPKFDANIKIARVFFKNINDNDGDGVPDFDDLCPETASGADVDEVGCSGDKIVDLECPCDNSWKNHGEYVSCVAHTAKRLLESNLITPADKDSLISTRAKSDCGKKDDDDEDDDD